MSKKRKCTFNDDLQKEFKFIKFDRLGKDGTKAVCQQCNAHFSVSHGGRSDINQHLQSQKHKEAEKAMASAVNIGSYFVTHSDGSESRRVAAIKACHSLSQCASWSKLSCK